MISKKQEQLGLQAFKTKDITLKIITVVIIGIISLNFSGCIFPQTELRDDIVQDMNRIDLMSDYYVFKKGDSLSVNKYINKHINFIFPKSAVGLVKIYNSGFPDSTAGYSLIYSRESNLTDGSWEKFTKAGSSGTGDKNIIGESKNISELYSIGFEVYRLSVSNAPYKYLLKAHLSKLVSIKSASKIKGRFGEQIMEAYKYYF